MAAEHAAFYLDENESIDMMVNAFFNQHGSAAIPVANSTDAAQLRKIQDTLQRNIVLCNATLLEVLSRSDRISSASQLMQVQASISPPPSAVL